MDGGVSVLHTACAAGHDSIVRLLLERGASAWAALSDPKQRGATPLAVAAQAGHAGCVALLLEEKLLNVAPPPAGAVASATDPPRSAPKAAQTVAKAGRATAPLTAYNGPRTASPAAGKLKAGAATLASQSSATQPLAAHLVATPMADGRTPLHLACEHGAIEVVQVLVGAMCCADPTSIDATDSAGFSPLDRACQSGHAEVAKLLLEAGATWRREGAESGSTALHIAVTAGKSACVAALLEAKADPEHSDRACCSPLLLASELGRTECALAMLSAPHLVSIPYPE